MKRMCERGVDEVPAGEPEIRGGDKPSDYIADAPLPVPPARPLRADAHEAEDDLDDDDES
jgi:hypothetical protein